MRCVASVLSSQALRIACKPAGGWAEPDEPAGREKRRPERAVAAAGTHASIAPRAAARAPGRIVRRQQPIPCAVLGEALRVRQLLLQLLLVRVVDRLRAARHRSS
jgi:hypothetical protein